MSNASWDEIENRIFGILQIHGCEVIVNGVYTTLKYYLRLLSNTASPLNSGVIVAKIKGNFKGIFNKFIKR